MLGLKPPRRKSAASAEPSPVREVLAETMAELFREADDMPHAAKLMAAAAVRGLTDAQARGIVRQMAGGLATIIQRLESRGVDTRQLLGEEPEERKAAG